MSYTGKPCYKPCNTNLDFIDNGAMSNYEKMCYIISQLKILTDLVNSFESKITLKEDSVNITNNRKLSETGDFTGTWFGETKISIDSRINNIDSTYQGLIDLINGLTNLNIEIIDGQFFLSTEPITEIDAGSFNEAVTEEIDGGKFIYPCICN